MQIVIAFLIHKAQNNATPNIFNSALSLFSGKKVKKKKNVPTNGHYNICLKK